MNNIFETEEWKKLHKLVQSKNNCSPEVFYAFVALKNKLEANDLPPEAWEGQ